MFVADPGSWWENYGDPTLDKLIQRAFAENLDIKAAAQRVEEARALAMQSKSALKPAVNLNGSAQQLRGGYQAGIVRIPQSADSGGGRSFVAPFETALVSASLDMRWEIGFWGPNSKQVNASRADLEAQMELQNQAALIVSAEVARNYFELRGIEDQLAVARRNLKNQMELLELLRMRSRAGLSAELDVERQSSILSSLDAAIPLLELQRSLRLNRLAVLLANRDLIAQPLSPAPATLKLPLLQAGIDSELLKRRPDVRAALARIQASAARVQQARSELYPKLLLTGIAGRQGTSFPGLSLGSGNFFNIGPQLLLPIFTGGKIRANIEANNAKLEQAKTEYEAELLAAFQEAEDAIAAYRLHQEQLNKLEEAAGFSRSALKLSQDLYKAGLGDFLGVLDAEKSVLELELAIADSRASAAVQSVLLFKALAGGWPQ
jgi:multidrug efflux system outer membrane protein